MKRGRRKKTAFAVWAIMLSCICMGIFTFVAGCGGCQQSRSWSRITGAPLKLTLPKDFERPVSFSSGREGEKDLFYESTDGTYKVKTYTDSGMWESEIEFLPEE